MLNTVTVTYVGAMHCEATGPTEGRNLAIDAPARCGGSGGGLSPFETFAMAYGSCVVMAMDKAAHVRGFGIAGAKIDISVSTSDHGAPCIDRIAATVTLPAECTEKQMEQLRRAAQRCPMRKVLREDIETTLTFETA